jgi:hypothetical protein
MFFRFNPGELFLRPAISLSFRSSTGLFLNSIERGLFGLSPLFFPLCSQACVFLGLSQRLFSLPDFLFFGCPSRFGGPY